MKSIYLIICSIALTIVVDAQNITNYQFAATNGSFTQLAGGTTMELTSGTAENGYFNNIPIGFTFYFMGIPYTTVSASTSGWLTFGQNITNAYITNNLSSSGNRPLIAPLWDNLSLQTNLNFSYQTNGTTPNRIFTAEWLNVKWYASASNAAISFQTRLFESTGKIEFVYRQESGSVQSGSASIGITSSGTGSGNYLSLSGSGTNPTASSTSEISNINIKPASGQVYTFSPPSPSPSSPVNMTFSSVTQTGMTMNWVDNSTTETNFLVDFSQDGINFSQVVVPSSSMAATGTTYSIQKTGLLPGITYYFRLTAMNEGTVPSAYLVGNQSTTAPGNILSIADGNWSNTSTWSTSAVPTTMDNVTISNGHTVIIDAAANCNGLTVGQGTSGTLRFGTTSTSLTTVQGVTVSTNGTFDAGAPAGADLTHQLNIGGNSSTALGIGNLTVNGSLDMYIGLSNGKCNITFFGIPGATVSGTGTIDFNSVTLNKGNTVATATVTPPVLEILAAYSSKGDAAAGMLATHTSGTLKIGGSFSGTNPVYAIAAYTIPATGAFWVANPNFIVTGMNGNPTNNGLLKLSSGTLNICSTSGNAMGATSGAVFFIEGGTMNIASRLNTATAVSYNQTNGIVNVTTVGNTASAAGFGLTGTGSSFAMSGGTICCVIANTSATGDYNVNSATTNITGGTLQLGNGNSGTTRTFRIRGTAPNVLLTNTTANHNCSLSGDLAIMGDLVLNGTGTFSNVSNYLTMSGMNASYPGNIIIGTGTTFTMNTSYSQYLTFNSIYGNQSLTNGGTITSNLLPCLLVNNSFGGAGTVTIPGGLILMGNSTLNLTRGTLNVGTGITLGTATTSGFTYIQGDGSVTGTVTRNFGTGTVNYTYNGTSAQLTNTLLPSSITGTFTINNSSGVTLNSALNAGKLTLTAGALNTTATNLLTITGTAVSDVSYSSGQVNGPLQRTLPANRTTGTTYLFPLGKNTYRPLELVNPITNAGGTVLIKAEVFDADCGGTPGNNMNALNTNRYWTCGITSGSANFTSSTLRLTETGLTSNHGIGKSATQNGVYDLVSSTAPTATTVVTDVMTTLGPCFYAIGLKNMLYVSSNAIQNNTDPIRQSSTDQQVIGIQVVTTGNLNPALVTSFTLNTNGSTSTGDIAAAKVYYTGSSTTFQATNQFGATNPNPAGLFTISGSQALVEGTNYFWLAYDIALNAGNGDLIDGECNSITVNGTAKTPTLQAPTGARTIKAALSGTVIVGSGGTYPTITGTGGLFEAINTAGVRGNITAQIISNTAETGSVALPQWVEIGGSHYNLLIQPGAAVERTVSGGYAGGLIRLAGADHVTIDGNFAGSGKYLNIINSNTSGTIAALQLVSSGNGLGSTNVTIKNCKISTGHAGSSSYGVAAGGSSPGSAGADNDSLVIQNCNISKAYYGIYAGATAAGVNNSLIITGDSIGSSVAGNYVGRFGVYMLYCTEADISGNTIFNIMNPSYGSRGLYFALGCINATISRNRISGIKYTGTNTYGSAGIDIMTDEPSSNMTISNNLITDITGMGDTYWASEAIVGIRIHAGTGGINLYYNSVNLFGNISHSSMGGDNSAAIYIAGTGGISLKNNIFRNSIVNTVSSYSKAYAIYSEMYKTGFTLIDYNDYFVEGTQGRLGYLEYGQNAATIEAWRSYTTQDVHSVGDDPLFKSATDLHLDFTSAALHGGNPVTGILTDNENVIRNGTTPSMGALETGTDARGPIISYSLLNNTASRLERTLIATLTDYTGVPVTGAGLPVLYWNINRGTWIPAPASAIGGSQYQFTFGSGVAVSDSVFYFIAAQDTWSETNVSVRPSAGAAGFSINPPACSTKPAYPDSYQVITGLNGTITIGTGGQFPTLTGEGGLFQMVNQNLLNGNVEAAVISDLTEPGTYSLYSWQEEGAGNFTVTIRPDGNTERLISGNVAQGMITLDGATRLTIKGCYGDTLSRCLRLRNTNNSYPVIQFLNGAQNITIRNCHLESGSSGIKFGTSSVLSGNSFNQILYNSIHNRTDITGALSSGITSTGTSSNPNHTNTIRGNEIYNYSSTGIFISATGNGGEWIISDNSFYNNLSTPPSTLQRGIYFVPGFLSFGNNITGNYIGGHSAQCGGNLWENTGTSVFTGIYLDAGSATNHIENNIISNIHLSNTNGGGFTGIMINEGWCGVAGNMIGNADISKSIRSNATDPFIYGISIESSSFCNIDGNTIANLVLTATSGNPWVYGIYINAANVTKNKLYGLGHCLNAGLWPRVVGIQNDGLSGADIEVSNNSISIDCGLSTDPEIYGYYENSYTANTNSIFYNSISISGPASLSSTTCALYRYIDATLNMKNNILANFRQSTGGGPAYALYFEDPGNLVSDFNDLYCAHGNLAYYNGIGLSELATWKTATAGDQHSISSDPLFMSNTSDLNPATGSLVVSAGVTLEEVTADINGNPRDPVSPTLGCYEVTGIINKTWNGAVSTGWNVAANWTPSGMPLATENVLIPEATPFYCTVNATGMVCKHITIASSGFLIVSPSNSLTVWGNLTIQDTGTLTNDGLLILKGNLMNLNTAK